MYYKNKTMSLFYEKYGKNKTTIIILPGWGDTRKTFGCLIKNLEKDYTIYIFDYPGFGKSTFPSKDLTIYDYGEYFKNFIEEKKIKTPIIIGHSFGGRIAILLSSVYKVNIQQMILIDAAGIKPKKTWKQYRRQTLYKGLKKLKYLLPSKIKLRYQKWLLKKFSSSDYQALPPTMMKTFQNIVNEDLTPYLSKIEAETLLIWGEKDLDTPLSDGIKMEKEIKESALIKLKNRTHYSYLEEPLLVIRILNEFLQEKKID